MANALINETSPYLLQHAHNPVEWFPWNDETLAKAKRENKLILVSIGYSACHWCHVMERECFEDEEVAEWMNRHFINIKVDREERPDIDQVYMTAVQVMSGRGGWPLNCITLPDGRPIYGGTYFPKSNWINVLSQLADLWSREPKKAEEYAERLTEGVRQAEQIIPASTEGHLQPKVIHDAVRKWQQNFDIKEGGPNRAPKFPLPDNYTFFLQYLHSFKPDEVLIRSGERPDPEQIRQHVILTLNKMARGGIYDQIGGGFCRYSTDSLWKVPHFEKMLYDNAQLIGLYAEAVRLAPGEEYLEVIRETINFCDRELSDPSGAYYSALDADSEGEEGKFYVWTKEEVITILGSDAEVCMKYYHFDQAGEWEGNFIPLRRESPAQFARACGWDEEALLRKVREWNKSLLHAREKRTRPGLDDKTLASWNAMMISGLCRASDVLPKENYLERAMKTAHFLMKEMIRDDGSMFHSWKKGKSSIPAFLEDLSFTALAFCDLYERTFDPSYLNIAEKIAQHTLSHYSDDDQCLFYFTSSNDTPLIVRKMEIHDNVIPSSTAVMGQVLWRLSHHLDKPEWKKRAERMYRSVENDLPSYPSGYSHWMKLGMCLMGHSAEVVIVGNSVDDFREGLRKELPPHLIFAGSRVPSDLPLLKARFRKDHILVYVCRNGTCYPPAETAEDALDRIKNLS